MTLPEQSLPSNTWRLRLATMLVRQECVRQRKRTGYPSFHIKVEFTDSVTREAADV